MSEPIVIRIPHWHPTSVNKLLRMHWAKRSRLVRDEYRLIAAYALKVGIHTHWDGGANDRRRVAVTFTLKPKQRACDPDAQLKGLLDGLKRCGAIVDDSRTWIDLAPVEYARGTATDWGTEIRITEAA